ncbi:hypothetical protein [Escherichia coli]
MTSGNGWDTPVKQHELVRRLQHDVAREHGFDMERQSEQTEPELHLNGSITVTWIFYGILPNMASTEEKLLTLRLSVEHLQHTAMEQQKAVADSLAVARETLRGYRHISDGVAKQVVRG